MKNETCILQRALENSAITDFNKSRLLSLISLERGELLCVVQEVIKEEIKDLFERPFANGVPNLKLLLLMENERFIFSLLGEGEGSLEANRDVLIALFALQNDVLAEDIIKQKSKTIKNIELRVLEVTLYVKKIIRLAEEIDFRGKDVLILKLLTALDNLDIA
jgi:sulfur transfer complex TusBCD TusB component (DsrH family)